jgi:hypothetical protein
MELSLKYLFTDDMRRYTRSKTFIINNGKGMIFSPVVIMYQIDWNANHARNTNE